MSKRGRVRTNNSTTLIENVLTKNGERIINFLDDCGIIYDDFYKSLYEYIDYDIRMIKDCTEKAIVDSYIKTIIRFFTSEHKKIHDLDELLLILRTTTRNDLASIYAPDISFDDTIDKYFNDVKREYIKHPMGESELCEMTDDNRDLFIKNNLKTVIECAKRYRGLGVDFEDLIQIGNMGLLKAWYKFDTSKSDLQDNIINEIKEFNDEHFTYDDSVDIIKNNFKYPKLLEQTIAKIPKLGFISKDDFIEWAKENIRKASFASLGFIWARAAITSELNGLSNIIRIPRSVKDDGDKVTFINLDSLNPHTDDNFNDDELFEVANEMYVESDDNIENMERTDMFKGIVNQMLNQLCAKDRRIMIKRFGINLPFPLSIADISEHEGIGQREVKTIIERSMTFFAENISEENRNIIMELL